MLKLILAIAVVFTAAVAWPFVDLQSAQSSWREPTNDPIRVARSPLARELSFELLLPAGYELGQFVVASNHRLSIGSHATILNADGTPGNAVNAGRETVSVQSGGRLGAVVSLGNIRVETEAKIGQVVSAREIALANRAQVEVAKEHVALTPLNHFQVSLRPADAVGADLEVRKGSIKNLAPGVYGNVVVEQGSRLQLSSGTYVFDSLDLDRASQVHILATSEAVLLCIKDWVHWNGSVSGDRSHFVLAYLGEDLLRFANPFQGIVLAPHATVELSRAWDGGPPAPHRGIFYGQEVRLLDGVTVVKLSKASWHGSEWSALRTPLASTR